MNTENPWLDDRTPEDFILERSPIKELTDQIVTEQISESEAAIRKKDVNGLMSKLALNFLYIGPELRNAKQEMTEGNRDRYLINICCLFDTSDCRTYTMEINSIKITSSSTAEASITVRNPGDESFYKSNGGEVEERIFISLHKQRPVVSRLEVEIAS